MEGWGESLPENGPKNIIYSGTNKVLSRILALRMGVVRHEAEGSRARS